MVWLWAAAGLAGVWVAVQAFETRLLYPSNRRAAPEEPDFEGLEVEEVDFCAEDGAKLHGLWFSQPGAKGVLLVCHGNGGSVGFRTWIPRDLRDVPLHVFLFDYRGYGKSEGVPGEKGTARDVAAAWEVAHERLGRPENPPILLYGRSLGGAVALQLPEDCPVRGVVLESTFTSIVDMGRRLYPWLLPQWTCRNAYRSDERIRRVRAPVLVAHSTEDELIPESMGRALYRRAPNPWGFCPLRGGHEEAGWQTSPDYAAAFRAFVGEVIPETGKGG